MLARRPSSASPAQAALEPARPLQAGSKEGAVIPVASKRAARIVEALVADDSELERRHLLARLLDSEGSVAITRAANAYRKAGFEFPEEQPVQLKLLEHGDEGAVCAALDVLTALLDEQAPIQLPVFEQRLKRLEDAAEEADTRTRAAELRRVLRT
jgi:hypothetical protein